MGDGVKGAIELAHGDGLGVDDCDHNLVLFHQSLGRGRRKGRGKGRGGEGRGGRGGGRGGGEGRGGEGRGGEGRGGEGRGGEGRGRGRVLSSRTKLLKTLNGIQLHVNSCTEKLVICI